VAVLIARLLLHEEGGGGGGGAAAVVNDQTLFADIGLPAMSFTPLDPPAIVAVYVVEAASDDDGLNVATFPFSDTTPEILVVPALRVNVDVLTVVL
jgi:hypothetical protein